MKNILLLLLFFSASTVKAQLYYPPLVGNTWETMDPSELGWCEDSILQMENWLETSTSKAFIVLKDGKIVIEKYFGTFTQDSLWVWNSAGKTLTGYAVGIAQTEGYLDIDDATTDYLGAGWTSATTPQENDITILNQLTMTSGLDDYVADPNCTDAACLQYLTAPNTRWAYHNAPYTLLDGVIENATGSSLTSYVNQKISTKIGLTGAFFTIGYNQVFVSKARGMARFGLLLLSNGTWNSTPVQTDLSYLQAMRTPSQTLNPSYGYLTWLNGQSGYQLPGLQFLFNGSLLPNAPADLYAAEGKNGQIINVVPSTGMVVIRMGATLGNSLVATQYNDTIWQYINRLDCGLSVQKDPLSDLKIGVDQEQRIVLILGLQDSDNVEVVNAAGTVVPLRREENQIDLKSVNGGVYFIRIRRNGYERVFKVPLN